MSHVQISAPSYNIPLDPSEFLHEPENFPAWQLAIKRYLRRQEIWGIVDKSITLDKAEQLEGLDNPQVTLSSYLVSKADDDATSQEKAKREWYRRAHVARDVISSTIARRFENELADVTVCWEMYDYLRDTCEGSPEDAFEDHVNAIMNLSFTMDQDLNSHFTQLRDHWGYISTYLKLGPSLPMADFFYCLAIKRSMPLELREPCRSFTDHNKRNPTSPLGSDALKANISSVYRDLRRCGYDTSAVYSTNVPNRNNPQKQHSKTRKNKPKRKNGNHKSRRQAPIDAFFAGPGRPLPKRRGPGDERIPTHEFSEIQIENGDSRPEQELPPATVDENRLVGIENRLITEPRNERDDDTVMAMSTGDVEDSHQIFLDTGASRHCSGNRDLFHNFKAIPRTVNTAGGAIVSPGEGDCLISFLDAKGRKITWVLKDVIYIPSAIVTLISIAAMRPLNWSIFYSPARGTAEISDANGKPVATFPEKDNRLTVSLVLDQCMFASLYSVSVDLETWHNRLSHTNQRDVKRLLQHVKIPYTKASFDCDACAQAKITREPFPPATCKTSRPLQLLHLDIMGPFNPRDVIGNAHALVICDDYSRYTKVYLLKERHLAPSRIRSFITTQSNKLDLRVKAIRMDNAPELTSHDFKSYLANAGIETQYTAGYSPASNGVAERYNRTLLGNANANRILAGLPRKFWGHSTLYTNYIRNLAPHHSKKLHIPITAYLGEEPRLHKARTFGCRVFVHQSEEQRDTKLDPPGKPGIFLGLSEEGDGYICWLTLTEQLVKSRNVIFREHELPYKKKSSTIAAPGLPGAAPEYNARPTSTSTDVPFREHHSRNLEEPSITPQTTDFSRPMVITPGPTLTRVPVQTVTPSADVLTRRQNVANEQRRNLQETSEEIAGHDAHPVDDRHTRLESSHPDTAEPSPEETHEDLQREESQISTSLVDESEQVNDTMPGSFGSPSRPTTRSQTRQRTADRIDDSSIYFTHTTDTLPNRYEQAMRDEHAKEWKDACDKEIMSHKINKTWKIVPSAPSGRDIVGTRWVFTKKTDSKGNVVQYKARLVAQGHSQRPGHDYDATYSPVVSLCTIRTLIAIAIKEKMHVHQMDVSAAYLHGEIDKEIHIHQPPGYADRRFPKGCCKLNKSIYGLKQSGRLWYEKLCSKLTQLGFTSNNADSCLFYNKRTDVIITVYVDDLLLISTDLKEISKVKADLTTVFLMKDLGIARYILGIEINYDRVHQYAQISLGGYIDNALKSLNLENCKIYKTPITRDHNLTKEQCPTGGELKEKMRSIPYANAVGILNWLAITTRPDISFAVHRCAQFSANPAPIHWDAVKRIFGYLKGTKDLKIHYRGNKGDIMGFTDADLGGQDGRRSTTGYVFCISGGATVWGSKKQSAVATSTHEAEYIALELGSKEAVWLETILTTINRRPSSPIVINCDNKGTIDSAHNPSRKSTLKHIDIRIHAANDRLMKKQFTLHWIPTKEQLADLFTKGFSDPSFAYLRNEIGLLYA